MLETRRLATALPTFFLPFLLITALHISAPLLFLPLRAALLPTPLGKRCGRAQNLPRGIVYSEYGFRTAVHCCAGYICGTLQQQTPASRIRIVRS